MDEFQQKVNLLEEEEEEKEKDAKQFKNSLAAVKKTPEDCESAMKSKRRPEKAAVAITMQTEVQDIPTVIHHMSILFTSGYSLDPESIK